MTRVYEAMAVALHDLGVRTAFGLMGEDTAGLIVELDRLGVPYRPANHENVAVAMADGYAWATGEVGVCLISRGPGLTNSITALTTAAKAGRRVLVVSGAQSMAPGAEVSDAKRIDQPALVEAVGAWSFQPEAADDVVPALRAAFEAARGGATAHLGVPPNLFGAALSEPVPPRTPAEQPAPVVALEPAAADVDRVATLLEGSTRPLILAGAGALAAGAADLLRELAERHGGLLGTTLLAKSAFRGHPADLGVVGGFSTTTAREVMDPVDVVVAFGAGLNSFTRAHGTIFPEATIVQVDLDATRLGQLGRVDVAVHADAAATARALLARVTHDRTLDPEVAAALAAPSTFGGVDESLPGQIDPRPLAVALDRLLPANRVVAMDAGHHFGFPAIALDVEQPGRFRLTSSFSAVGMGLGTATGAALGRPGLPVVTFIGDGGLLMTLGDLQTLRRYDAPIIIVVMNDAAYGAERHFLDLEGLPHELAGVPAIDFAPIAEGFGIPAATIRTLDDLDANAALLQRVADGPVLLDCKIHPAVRAQWIEDLDASRKRQFAEANR